MKDYQVRLYNRFPIYKPSNFDRDKEMLDRAKEIDIVQYLLFFCPFYTLGELADSCGFKSQSTISHFIKNEGYSQREFNVIKRFVKNTIKKTLIKFDKKSYDLDKLEASMIKSKLSIESLEKENKSLRKLLRDSLDLLNARKDYFLKGVDSLIDEALYELGKEVK